MFHSVQHDKANLCKIYDTATLQTLGYIETSISKKKSKVFQKYPKAKH